MAELHVAPGTPLIEAIRAACANHAGGSAHLAVAWARDEGAHWLLDAAENRINDLHVIVGLNERATTVEALLRLLPRVSTLHAYFKHPRQTFHPKMYAFRKGNDASLLVGSSNLTKGGLFHNIEGSLVVRLDLSEDDKALLDQFDSFWTDLLAEPYAHSIQTDDDIKALYEGGYLMLERTLRRRSRNQEKKGATSPAGLLPTAPPKWVKATGMSTINIPFDIASEETEETVPETHDPTGVTPHPYRFYVRTLTANDVEKLQGRRVGTFEPDLGQTARDRYPAFWGWPNEYETIVRSAGIPREEWKASSRLYSSATGPAGIEITMTLWYREARPGHAAEHRMGLGPIAAVRSAVPPTFDTAGVVVVERASDGAGHVFDVRLLTPDDIGFDDFASHLSEQRPEHMYGYGP